MAHIAVMTKPMKPNGSGPLRRITATLKRDGLRSALFSCGHTLKIERDAKIIIGEFMRCEACLVNSELAEAA